MEYTLALDASTEQCIRTLLCLFLFELFRYRIVAATESARFVRMPHTLAVLLAYLAVTYALTVGIVEGDYGASIVWSASVGVVVWGVCNAVLMNISSTWSRQMAEDDVMAGIVSCVLAGVAGANALNVWYLIAAIAILLLFTHEDSGPGSGMLPYQALTIRPIPITVLIHGQDHGGTVTFVADNLFVVDLVGKIGTAGTYREAVLEAARASHPSESLQEVTLKTGEAMGTPTFAEIHARAELTSLRAT